MFRRNKAKGAKAKPDDDSVVPLTGPDILSSSSSAEFSKGRGGGRILGMGKKKNTMKKGESGYFNASGVTNTSQTNGNGTNGDPAQTQINTRRIPESAPPQSKQKRQPQLKNISVVATKAPTEEARIQVPPQPSVQQRVSSQTTASTKSLETSDVTSRSSSNIPTHLPPLMYASDWGNNSDGRRATSVSKKAASRAPTEMPSFAPAAAKPPTLIVNGGEQQVNGTASDAIPLMRNGWSMQSNASSAMNSESYIRSLDNLPPLRSGKPRPMLSAQPGDTMREKVLADNGTRAALSRQFGRNYPPQTFEQRWFVSVGRGRWDNGEKRFKYKVSMSREASSYANGDNESLDTESLSHLSIDSTTTRRSLQDFVWLEQALRAEYHGALIVPILSIVLYFEALSENVVADEQDDDTLASRSFATVSTSKSLTLDSNGNNAVVQSFKFLEKKIERNEIVNETTLANWLSDIINGVRGNGEVLLYNCGDVVQSEAMETFLFRNSDTLNGCTPLGSNQRSSGLGSPFSLFSWKRNCHGSSLIANIMGSPLECFLGTQPECGGDKKKTAQDAIERMQNSNMCLTGTTGVLGMDGCNSNEYNSEVESDSDWRQLSSQGTLAHSALLEAERDLILSYLKSISLAMSSVQSLIKDENAVGQNWKRLAISLSNLFSVEKDLEQAHIGDQIKCSKNNQPFRKLRKSSVDEVLRLLARAKIDRSNPSLRLLQSMLNAYFTDLNSIIPAFREHSEAMYQLCQFGDTQVINPNRGNNQSSSIPITGNIDWLPSSLDQLKTLTLGVTNKLSGSGSVASDHVQDDDSTLFGSLTTAQSRVLQSRVLQNEKMLKFSITLMCKASPLRNARMAWWYLKTEAKQALNVHTAATTLGQKLIADDEAVAVMKDRRYDEDEKKDNEAEIELVKRILDLGSSVDARILDQQASRRSAIQIATEHVGKWNAKTALALMEAAGVEDAEVQIDETSRELRHVRKFAISLRESVASCIESAKALESSYALSAGNSIQISRSRREFWAAISTVFSGKVIYHEINANGPDTRVLASGGIDVTDRGGWLGHSNIPRQPVRQQRQNCGEAARQYLKKRDNQASILISRLIKLLQDYEHRLVGIESFVYMHCVGIQLEKHCSRARSKALSAWEKRTDISTAINVATKKRIPRLVQELKVKLDSLPQVSHTTVIKRKEDHLASKMLKSDLHRLANRRFGRAQEVSTERVIAIMSLWAKHEESVAIEEVTALGEVVQEVELSIQRTHVGASSDLAAR